MKDRFFSAQNINFLLFETHGIQDLSRHEYYREYDKDTLDIMLSTVARAAFRLMRPYLKEMDNNPPAFSEGRVTVHPSVREYIRTCGEIGLLSSCIPFSDGGHQVPHSAAAACGFIFSAANPSLAMYSVLTAATADIIASYGSAELKRYYLPELFAGRWQGTYAFTEPDAGSSPADIKTKATPTGEGYYFISGKKVFISAGTHNSAENVIHLTAARIEGAPPGTAGLSLFAVPELRGDGMGGLVPNDVTCTGIENKTGYRGVPVVQLSLGDNRNCYGWIVGGENRGFDLMTRLLNMQRINSALASAGIASAAYYESLEFSMEREQGRRSGDSGPGVPQCRIIEHADVKRMLLSQKTFTEGVLSLAIQAAVYNDMIHTSPEDDRDKYELLIDFLTPVLKCFSSGEGISSVKNAMRVMGGYGYCEDFNSGQFFRDSGMHQVYAGTAGVLAREFLSGLMSAKQGLEFELFTGEVKSTVFEALRSEALSAYGRKLGESLSALQETTDLLRMTTSSEGLEVFLADASLYIEMTGIVATAWQWLLMALCAENRLVMCTDKNLTEFYNSKIHAMKYYYKYELIRVFYLSEILMDPEKLTTGVGQEVFLD